MTGQTDLRAPARASEASRRRIREGALRAALIYAGLGWLWIVFSDQAVEWAVADPDVRSTIQTWKGLIFVGVSALAVGFLAYRELARENAASAQLAALAEFSAAGIYVLQDDEIVVANERAVEMLRAGSRSDVEGRHILEIVDPADHERFQARLTELIEEGRHEPQRIQMRRFDGSSILVEIEARRVDWEGRRAEIGVMFDVTEIEAAAGRERARARLETIGQLTAAISHDLRNMLTTIAVPLEVAREGVPPDAEGRAELDEAASATQRAVSLTRQLLAFGRPGRSDPRPVDLASYLDELRPMLARAAGPGVGLAFEVRSDLPAVEIDPSGLSQVLLNLVLNASEAMGGTGRVEVVVEEGAPTEGAGVRLSVSDTGPGLDSAVARNLFEPFFTTKEEGTGLGLATVRRIVEEAGGTIEPDLGVARGARFVLDFPASDRPAVPTEAIPTGDVRPRAEVDGPAARVLLLEDETSVRRAVRRALERAGFEVRSATTCGEARAALADGAPPDVFVTDVGLPDGSGLDVAAVVAEAHPSVGVVMMSGGSQGDASFDVPGAWFVEKPFVISELVAAARAARDAARGRRASGRGDPPRGGSGRDRPVRTDPAHSESA